MKVVVVSGGFDPIHSGHIAYFESAKKLGDKLIVALNSDQWLVDKKGNIRGYYNGMDTEEMNKLKKDINSLLSESI